MKISFSIVKNFLIFIKIKINKIKNILNNLIIILIKGKKFIIQNKNNEI